MTTCAVVDWPCQARLVELITQHQLSVIAIGNGTACRETEEVVSELIAALAEGRCPASPLTLPSPPRGEGKTVSPLPPGERVG